MPLELIEVVRDVDGDTLRGRIVDRATDDPVGEELNLRLYGIDTPELDQFGGRAAAAQLDMYFLASGNRLWMRRRGRGPFRRHIVELFLLRSVINTLSINALLVRAGFAWHDTRFAPGNSLFASLQSRAQQAQIGIWIALAALGAASIILNPGRIRVFSPVAPWIWRSKPGLRRRGRVIFVRRVPRRRRRAGGGGRRAGRGGGRTGGGRTGGGRRGRRRAASLDEGRDAETHAKEMALTDAMELDLAACARAEDDPPPHVVVVPPHDGDIEDDLFGLAMLGTALFGNDGPVEKTSLL